MENKIQALLQSRDYAEIVRIASEMDASEAAKLLSEFSEEDLVQVLSLFEDEKLGEFLPEFDKDTQNLVVTRLNQKKLQSVMDEISVDDTIDIIDNLPAPVASKVVEMDEIRNLLSKKRFKSLKELLCNINPIDIAAVFEDLEEQERVLTFRLLSKDAAAEVFVELASDVQEELIRNLSDKELKSVIEEIFIDDAVDLIEEMPASVVKRLLAQSDAETRNYINELLKYPQNSTGSIMTVEFVSLSKNMTVRQAFERIRACAIDKETVYTCYVTDETKHLLGVTTVRELLLSDVNVQIGDIMHENVICAHTLDDREDTARRIREYGFLALPVVDDEMRLVGIVTIDDAIDVMVDETTEDISKIAATRPSDKPYLKTSVWSIFKNRIPWLLILMVSATFTGLIINKFESRLNAISTVLIACVPMLMDTGGNAGAQASVTVIRALALNEIKTKDIFKVLWKEIRASLLLALCLAIACFAKLQLIDNLLFGYADYTLVRCAVVSLSLFITVIIAKLIGCSLPILAKAVKLDPAVVASPFITTIVDALSLMIFCMLSVSILS